MNKVKYTYFFKISLKEWLLINKRMWIKSNFLWKQLWYVCSIQKSTTKPTNYRSLFIKLTTNLTPEQPCGCFNEIMRLDLSEY